MGSTPASIYSASGISAILGLNQHKTKLHAWQEIQESLTPGFNESKGYTFPEFPDNAPIRWGTCFEAAIIKLTEEKHGYQITEREKSYTKKFDQITLSAHLDGRIDENTLMEGKTTWNRAFYSIKGEDVNDETGEIEYKRRWGEPGTDEVPAEYQVQTAVQRICTGAELVKLSVLVFPKSTQEFEDLGWDVREPTDGDLDYSIREVNTNTWEDPFNWAKTFAQIGNFHTYLLPTNEKLETGIIEAIQEFDEKYVKPELPPPATNYPDIRRLITAPMGCIIATPEMVSKAAEYSEIVRELGKRGPTAKRQEALKVEIMNFMNTQRKDDWAVPNDKLVLISPDGGEMLINYSKSGFRARKAT